MRTFTIRHCFVMALFVITLIGVLQNPASGVQMTINGIDDAGQYAGQEAYVQFVDTSGNPLITITTGMVPNQWISKNEVYTFASGNDTLKDKGWFLQSAGNIWSSNTIVGDTFIAPHAGVYRISPISPEPGEGFKAFMYDSFNWSPVEGKYLWQLQIYDDVVGGKNYTLGSDALYDTAALAFGAVLGEYIDITLTEGERLIFWIADGSLTGDPSQRNTIDNAGGLTFDVAIAPIPEPSTFIFIGTGLLLLAGRFRKSLIRTR